MKKVLLVAILVLSLGCAMATQTQAPDTTEPEVEKTKMLATETKASATGSPQSPDSTFMPCEGPPSGKVGTPEGGRVLIAHSTDGIYFERPRNAGDAILVDRAGVPDGIVLPSGRVLVYFVDGCRPREDPNNTGTAVAVSDKQGAPGSWVYKHIRFLNVPESDYGAMPFDPNVVVLPDGNIRMFATMSRLKPEGSQEHFATHSFRSTDGGFTFEYEGLRYEGVLDPENYRFSDTNWQIITMDPNHRQIGWAMSTDDGNTFKSIGAFPSADGYPWEIAATDKPDEYRVYLGTPEGIISYHSDTVPWTTWTQDLDYRLQLDTTTGLESCEVTVPVVLKLAPGNYLMVYLTTIPGCSCGGDPTCS